MLQVNAKAVALDVVIIDKVVFRLDEHDALLAVSDLAVEHPGLRCIVQADAIRGIADLLVLDRHIATVNAIYRPGIIAPVYHSSL